MLSKEDILKIKKRRQIYDKILKYPGLHLRELSRRTNVTFGSLRYHLDILEKNEYIKIYSDKRFTRYYATEKTSQRDKILLNIIRQEVPRKIILLLIMYGPGEFYKDYNVNKPLNPNLFTSTHSKKEMVELSKYWDKPFNEQFQLKKHRTTVDFHLKKMLDAGIIEKIKVGKEIKYSLKDEFEIWYFLANYRKSFSDKLVNIELGWFSNYVTNKIDNVLEVLFDIFPHPYHA